MDTGFPVQLISLLILKIGNTDDIVLLKGEQPDDPETILSPEEQIIRAMMHKLPGGKFESARDLIGNTPNDTQNVLVAGLHEFGEEAGLEVRPQHIVHGASVMFPYNGTKIGIAHTLIASITETDFKHLHPASGEFVRINLHDIHSDPFANTVPITPMNVLLIDFYRQNGATHALLSQNIMPVNDFGRQYLMQ